MPSRLLSPLVAVLLQVPWLVKRYTLHTANGPNIAYSNILNDADVMFHFVLFTFVLCCIIVTIS